MLTLPLCVMVGRPFAWAALVLPLLPCGGTDAYDAYFQNGARSPPRTMVLVLPADAGGNATLEPAEGVERRAWVGLRVDWYEHPATVASFADRVVVSAGRYGGVGDADASVARQFVFLDAIHLRPCAEAFPATAPAAEARFRDDARNVSLPIRVLAVSPAVAVVEDFVSTAECEAMVSLAAAGGARARTDAEGGLSHAGSPFRRRRGVLFPWARGDALPAALLARASALAAVFGIAAPASAAQEPVNLIEYGEKDAYEPHCDSDCLRDGPVGPGARVATVLVYCAAPDLGGATVFPDRGGGRALKIAPAANAALVFSYETGARGALHAGCAVRRGTKRVLSIFLRTAFDGDDTRASVDVDGLAAPPRGPRGSE